MRRRLLAFMVVSGMALMTACSGSSQPEKTTAAQTAAKEEKAEPESTEAPKAEASEESKEESGGGKVYGYITPGPGTYYQRNVEGFQMGAEKDGNKVVVLNSDYDVSKEVSNIDSMINQGVDGLCIFSFNERPVSRWFPRTVWERRWTTMAMTLLRPLTLTGLRWAIITASGLRITVRGKIFLS